MAGSSSSAHTDPFVPTAHQASFNTAIPFQSLKKITISTVFFSTTSSQPISNINTPISSAPKTSRTTLHNASILVSVNEYLAHSVGLLPSNISRFPVSLLHHINIRIQVSKRQTSDGMVCYKFEVVATGEDANNDFVRPEYEGFDFVTMENRMITR
jgi:hypothetical protein